MTVDRIWTKQNECLDTFEQRTLESKVSCLLHHKQWGSKLHIKKKKNSLTMTEKEVYWICGKCRLRFRVSLAASFKNQYYSTYRSKFMINIIPVTLLTQLLKVECSENVPTSEADTDTYCFSSHFFSVCPSISEPPLWSQINMISQIEAHRGLLAW